MLQTHTKVKFPRLLLTLTLTGNTLLANFVWRAFKSLVSTALFALRTQPLPEWCSLQLCLLAALPSGWTLDLIHALTLSGAVVVTSTLLCSQLSVHVETRNEQCLSDGDQWYLTPSSMTDSEIKCSSSTTKFAEDTKPSGAAAVPEGQGDIQGDLERLEAHESHMKLSKTKCKVLPRGQGKPQ